MRGECLCEELRLNQLKLLNELLNERLELLQAKMIDTHIFSGGHLTDQQIIRLEQKSNQVTDEYGQVIHIQTVIRSMIESQDGIEKNLRRIINENRNDHFKRKAE